MLGTTPLMLVVAQRSCWRRCLASMWRRVRDDVAMGDAAWVFIGEDVDSVVGFLALCLCWHGLLLVGLGLSLDLPLPY